jgi:hypothetical protein
MLFKSMLGNGFMQFSQPKSLKLEEFLNVMDDTWSECCSLLIDVQVFGECSGSIDLNILLNL